MKALGAALALMGWLAFAFAQDATVYNEQSQIARTGQISTALGTDLLGDKVNLYNGTLEFIHTDVSLPGNDSLPVAVGRRYDVSAYAASNVSLGLFGDWDLEIPHLHGVFAGAPASFRGWNVWVNGTVGSGRCTSFGSPADAVQPNSGNEWDTDQFWGGNFLYVPGIGDQKMLKREAAFTLSPSDGNTYGVVTTSNWQLRCLTTGLRVNGVAAVGDGFIAVAPDGTQYRFDWMVSRWAPPLQTSAGSLARTDIWILPTVVTDRFGNTVTYTYSTANPWQLMSIAASDGRVVSLTYHPSSNRVATVTDGSRTWSYAYSPTNPIKLTAVTLPDGSSWAFAMAEQQTKPTISPQPGCSASNVWSDGTVIPGVLTSTVTHPSGVVGTFGLSWVAHGRANIIGFPTNPCPLGAPVADQVTPVYPARSLTSKSISGPGLATSSWLYEWGPPNGSWYCSGCPATKTLTVTDPRSFKTRYTFSNLYQATEGQMLQIDEGWDGSTALRTTALSYRAYNAGPYVSRLGWSGRNSGDSRTETSFLPLTQRTVTLQGTNFVWQATEFDAFARPTSVTRSSSLGYSRTEATAYADSTSKWVLGQVASVTELSTGAVMVSNTYDSATANLLSTSQFGKLQQSFSYNNDGTVYKRFDAAGRATTFSNYKRGLAQNASYPDGNAESAEVHNTGVVTSTTDAAGFTTSYGYDAMGRLNLISRPSGDSVNWNTTSLTFERVTSSEYDLPAGHWRQTVATGNARRVTYFDGLWRAVLTKTFDNANPGGSGNDVLRRFDADGRTTYESYPTRGVAAGSVNSFPVGTTFVYDALGRSTQTSASSELGTLTTTTNYLAAFKKQVVNPRGYATTTSYQAFDQPSEDAAVFIAAPEGLTVSIARDVFGKPTSISRSGAYGGGTVGAMRSYVYDSNQRLCKTIEPETGATVQDYDAANNVAWRATGLPFTATNNCNRGDVR